MDSELTSRRGMGDLHLDRSMLQTHYRSEDSHRGPFKASDRNLSSSDLKCRPGVRDGNGIAVGSDLQQTLPTGACRPPYQPSHRRVSSWVTATFGAEWTLVGSRYPTDRGQISNVGQETEGQAFWKLVFKLDPKLTKSRSSWKCFARVYRGFIINLLLKPAVMMRRAGVQAIVGSGVAWVSL